VDGDPSGLHVLVLRPDGQTSRERERDRRPVLRVASGHPLLSIGSVRLVDVGRLPIDRHDAEGRKQERCIEPPARGERREVLRDLFGYRLRRKARRAGR
jgi:hypothetical protein